MYVIYRHAYLTSVRAVSCGKIRPVISDGRTHPKLIMGNPGSNDFGVTHGHPV